MASGRHRRPESTPAPRVPVEPLDRRGLRGARPAARDVGDARRAAADGRRVAGGAKRPLIVPFGGYRWRRSCPPSTSTGSICSYELTGSGGDPLVLVHGSWVDHTTFALVEPTLSHGFRLLTSDRRGHGRSERPKGRRTIDDDVSDLAGLLEGLDLYPAHVAGSSRGGPVAIHLATDRPDLLRSLISHEAPLIGLADRPDPELDRALEAMGEVTTRVVDGDARGAARTFVDAVALGPGAWERLSPSVQEGLVANAGSSPDEYFDEASTVVDATKLSEFDPPALLTYGQDSPTFSRRLSERLASILPNAELRSLPGTGHVPHLTHPQLYTGTLVQFCLERSVPSA